MGKAVVRPKRLAEAATATASMVRFHLVDGVDPLYAASVAAGWEEFARQIQATYEEQGLWEE